MHIQSSRRFWVSCEFFHVGFYVNIGVNKSDLAFLNKIMNCWEVVLVVSLLTRQVTQFCYIWSCKLTLSIIAIAVAWILPLDRMYIYGKWEEIGKTCQNKLIVFWNWHQCDSAASFRIPRLFSVGSLFCTKFLRPPLQQRIFGSSLIHLIFFFVIHPLAFL